MDFSGFKLWLPRAAFLFLLLAFVALFIAGLPSQYEFSSGGYVGVRISYNAAGEPILTPMPGLAAAEAGIQPGDVLLRVEGVPVVPFSPRAGIQLGFFGAVDEPIRFEIRRADGTVRTVSVNRDARLLEQLGLSPAAYASYFILLDIFVALGLLIPALIIFFQKSKDWFAVYLAATLVIVAAGNTDEVIAFGLLNPAWGFIIPVQAVIYNILVLMLLFLFPNGTFVPRWTRYVLGVGILWAFLKQLPAPYNPLYQAFYIGNIFDLGIFGLGIYAQIYRYRNVTTRVERQQTKWIVYGMTIAFIGLYGYNFPPFVIPALQEPSATTFGFRIIGHALASMSLMVLSASFLFSIQRYRLYDIDLIINRTLVYVPLTAILAGIFAVTSDLSKRFFLQIIGGNSEASGLFATLVIVIAFEPIKDAIQKRVDKLFKRLPDPEKNIDAFIERVQTRVYSAELVPLTRNLLEEAVQGFQTQGGAIFLNGSASPLHAARGWNGSKALEIPLRNGTENSVLGTLALSVRRDGQGYSKRDRALLERAAQVVTQAIEQDQNRIAST